MISRLLARGEGDGLLGGSPTSVRTGSERPPTFADVAAQRIREAILSGELKPGVALPLHELAERFGTSVMPIRDALVRLEVEGLVDAVPQRGARVSAVSVVDLEDTYRTRITLEGTAVRWAAGRIQRADMDRLHAVLDQYASSDEVTGRTYHRQFHFGLYAHSGSRWILRLVSPLWENSERYRRLSLRSRGSIADRRREHERILEACYAGDADAAAALLAEHLTRTADLVKLALAAMGADPPAP